MHILFSPEKASDVGDFGVAFNRFKHVNRLCERYFPSISSLFHLSNRYALILCSKPTCIVFYTHSAQITAFTDIRMANPIHQRCFALCCFLLFLSFSSIFDHVEKMFGKKCIHSLAQEGGRFPAVVEELFTEGKSSVLLANL